MGTNDQFSHGSVGIYVKITDLPTKPESARGTGPGRWRPWRRLLGGASLAHGTGAIGKKNPHLIQTQFWNHSRWKSTRKGTIVFGKFLIHTWT